VRRRWRRSPPLRPWRSGAVGGNGRKRLVLFDFSLAEFVRFWAARPGPSSLAVHDVGDRELAKQYGIVDIDDSGRLVAFVEKPAPGEADVDTINAGTEGMEPAVPGLGEPGRERVVSAIGVEGGSERWYDGEGGPQVSRDIGVIRRPVGVQRDGPNVGHHADGELPDLVVRSAHASAGYFENL